MEFRILGPLEVLSAQGEPIPLPGRREQTLVGILLLFAGMACDRDMLARAMWPDTAPGDTAAALRVCMTRARKALGRGPRSCLQTLDGAYRADPDPGELDLARFRQFRADGTRLALRGDLDEAARAFEAATGCWRGQMLPGLPEIPELAAETARLAEERRLADLAHTDMLLGLGRHEQIVAELHERVIADPLCERRWAQLIEALHRCGRQDDALAIYSKARAVLIRAVGTEPGPDIAALLPIITQPGRSASGRCEPRILAATYGTAALT